MGSSERVFREAGLEVGCWGRFREEPRQTRGEPTRILWITEYCKTQIPPSPSGWAEDVSHRIPTEEARVMTQTARRRPDTERLEKRLYAEESRGRPG